MVAILTDKYKVTHQQLAEDLKILQAKIREAESCFIF